MNAPANLPSIDRIGRGLNVPVGREDLHATSLRGIGNVSIGRDPESGAILLALRHHDGLRLTASLSGYGLDKIAEFMAQIVEADVHAAWARRAGASVEARRICLAAAEVFGIAYSRLLGPDRAKPFTHARFAACWVARRATMASLPQIAQHIGYVDHTSVLHAVRQAELLRATDMPFRSKTDALLAQAGGAL